MLEPAEPCPGVRAPAAAHPANDAQRRRCGGRKRHTGLLVSWPQEQNTTDRAAQRFLSPHVLEDGVPDGGPSRPGSGDGPSGPWTAMRLLCPQGPSLSRRPGREERSGIPSGKDTDPPGPRCHPAASFTLDDFLRPSHQMQPHLEGSPHTNLWGAQTFSPEQKASVIGYFRFLKDALTLEIK